MSRRERKRLRKSSQQAMGVSAEASAKGGSASDASVLELVTRPDHAGRSSSQAECRQAPASSLAFTALLMTGVLSPCPPSDNTFPKGKSTICANAHEGSEPKPRSY
jgi:hypothetical protein